MKNNCNRQCSNEAVIGFLCSKHFNTLNVALRDKNMVAEPRIYCDCGEILIFFKKGSQIIAICPNCSKEEYEKLK